MQLLISDNYNANIDHLPDPTTRDYDNINQTCKPASAEDCVTAIDYIGQSCNSTTERAVSMIEMHLKKMDSPVTSIELYENLENHVIVTQEKGRVSIVTQERNHITFAFPTGCFKYGKSLPAVYVSAIDILWIIIASNIKTFEFWRVRKKKKV